MPNIDADVFEKVFKAIKQNRTISFGYRSISRTELKKMMKRL